MERIRLVPFTVNFDLVKKVDTVLVYILYLSVILGVSTLLADRFIHNDIEAFTDNINYVIGVLAVFYFLGDFTKRFLLQQAEQRRRKDFIDNSLKTNLVDFKSQGFFSNDELSPGVYKMGVNCFENSFFSMTISGKMIARTVILSLFVILIFCMLVMTDSKITVATFLQFALPYSILQQTIVLIIYHLQITSIFNYFKLLFSSAQEDKRNHLLVHNVINYESTISWAGLLLSSKLFNKYNAELSKQWEQLKLDHQIQ
jgi:hypothetical protein